MAEIKELGVVGGLASAMMNIAEGMGSSSHKEYHSISCK